MTMLLKFSHDQTSDQIPANHKKNIDSSITTAYQSYFCVIGEHTNDRDSSQTIYLRSIYCKIMPTKLINLPINNTSSHFNEPFISI